MLDSDVLDIIFAMQVLFTLPGICVIPLKSLSNHANASAWVLLGTRPKVPGKAPRPSLNRLPCFQQSRFACSRPTMKTPDNLVPNHSPAYLVMQRLNLTLSMNCSKAHGLRVPSNVRLLHHSYLQFLMRPPSHDRHRAAQRW
jgi:hypothetical protein